MWETTIKGDEVQLARQGSGRVDWGRETSKTDFVKINTVREMDVTTERDEREYIENIWLCMEMRNNDIE